MNISFLAEEFNTCKVSRYRCVLEQEKNYASAKRRKLSPHIFAILVILTSAYSTSMQPIIPLPQE